MYSICAKESHFTSNEANPNFWIPVSHNMIITLASALNVSHSPGKRKKTRRSRRGKRECLRAEMKGTGTTGLEGAAVASLVSGCWLSSSHPRNLDLLLTTELCDPHIHLSGPLAHHRMRKLASLRLVPDQCSEGLGLANASRVYKLVFSSYCR